MLRHLGADLEVCAHGWVALMCESEPPGTLQAKLLWCLKVVEDHQSFHSCLGNNQLFQHVQWMFPDLAIAKNFQLSESKCKCMTVFGLGPYVQNILIYVPTSRRALIMSFFLMKV